MITWINSSFWSLVDLRHLQPGSQRNEMLTVGSEGVFPALLVTILWAAPSTATPPPFSLLLCTYAYKMTNFLHSSTTIPHCFATYVERWSQEAKSLASFHVIDRGKRWIYGKSQSVVLQTEEGAKQSHLAVSPSSLWICHISRSACVFHQKLGTHRPQAGKYLQSRWNWEAGSLNPYLTLYFLLMYFQSAAPASPKRGRGDGSQQVGSQSVL